MPEENTQEITHADEVAAAEAQTDVNEDTAIAHEEETHAEVGHEEAGGPIGAVAGQFGLNGQMFVGQLINFLIVLIVLWAFVYKPIVKMLDERQEKIAKSVKQADEIERRLKAVEDERDQVITESKKEAQKIIEQAQKDATTRGEEMIIAAKNEVEKTITKGKQQLEDEKVEMMRNLKQEIIEITVSAAEKVLREQVDEDKSKAIAEDVVTKMV